MISFFANHRTAANLLLTLMIVCGLVAITKINRQFFPDFGIDIVTITVPWPGASASDIERNIVQAVEPELRFLNGVKKLTSSSYEGTASIIVEFQAGHNMQEALSDIESTIAQVTTLPEEAEKPIIKRLVRYETVSRWVLSGKYPEQGLKEYATKIRDELLDRGIDKVELYGAREDEIWIEVRPEALQKFNLKLIDISNVVAQTSLDMPAGELGGGGSQVRSLGLRTEARELAGIEIKALPDGRRLLLKDIANVSESYKEGARRVIRKGHHAIELEIKRSVNTDALVSSEIARSYGEEINKKLPPQLLLEEYDVQAKSIRERIGLLVTNGVTGLLLVLAVLFLFLSARVALWVAIGIPASLLATVAIMWASGQTINMISLFGMIMAIGIVVDDAIVVGEHAEYQSRQGYAPIEAAVLGATRMAAPVCSSTLTTVAAFLPLFMISGIMGQIISAIPFVVVAVLVASLIECFLVLPAHLGHALNNRASTGFAAKFRQNFDPWFERFRSGLFKNFARFSVKNRYGTAAFAISLFVISVSAVIGGRVGYEFFPSPEPNTIYANVEMRAGTSRNDTRDTVLALEAALYTAIAKVSDDPKRVIIMAIGKTGTNVGTTRSSENSRDTLGGVTVELVSSEDREIKAAEVISLWRDNIERSNLVESLTFESARAGPPGGDMDLRLRGGSPESLKAAAGEIALLMGSYTGVSDIEDNLPFGKPEIHLTLNSRGRALGFTTMMLAQQVRNAIDGSIAKRFPRGDEEVLVRVQYERSLVQRGLLNQVYVTGPDGSDVPLTSVADFKTKQGFSTIRRESGQREVAIRAEVNMAVTRPQYLRQALIDGGLLEICERYGLTYAFAGRAEDERETTSDMLVGTVLGLTFIYIILAWVFSSYIRPLVIMAVIPVGFVGAVLGHAVWGFDLTILSIFAILGLSGIVINDSIVLVRTIDSRMVNEAKFDAIVNGSCDRLRAVILTSATTIGGLLPLLFETSLQAQFLIPMALTLVFGLALTTFVVLLLIPALIMIQEDIRHFFQKFSMEMFVTKLRLK